MEISWYVRRIALYGRLRIVLRDPHLKSQTSAPLRLHSYRRTLSVPIHRLTVLPHSPGLRSPVHWYCNHRVGPGLGFRIDRSYAYWPSAAFFPRLFASLARTAFVAIAERCSGESFFARAFPPFLPPILPCSRKYSRTLSGIAGGFAFAMASILPRQDPKKA